MMPENPLLIFPLPDVSSRSKKGPNISSLNFPSHQKQGERLIPKFENLQRIFNERRAEILQTAAGTDPEQVIVIETIGSIEDFAKAVKRIEDLEWMGELEIDEIIPDEDFFDKKRAEKELSGRLYLVMTNQRALSELLSLWRRYESDPQMTFVRGLTKFRDVFKCLKDIRRWDVQDRLLETGVIDAWQEDLKYDENRIIRFETELWFRNSSEKRKLSEEQVSHLIQSNQGQILNQCVIEEIAYHGILAELPARSIKEIISNPATELVKCDNIMFFRPVGQMSPGDQATDGDIESYDIDEIPLPTGEPTIAILDGLPLAHHKLLEDRLIIDDPENWAEFYSASECIHGTAISSLIVHGDLDGNTSEPLSRPVYIRPIMKPDPMDFRSPKREVVPEDSLIVDRIHIAVKRIMEGTSDHEAVAPSVKVINLSIGDPSKQFTYLMSPIARLIDWLSFKYNVLFIISAGNHTDQIAVDVSNDEFDQMTKEEIENIIVHAVYKDARNRKIIAPAESINGVTVGCAHFDDSEITHRGDRFDPYDNIFPSPISKLGSGYRRSVKPDMIYYGGKQFFRKSIRTTNPLSIEPAVSLSAPGNRVAIPGNLPGDLNATAYCCGTSNAAALISRSSGLIFDTLLEIFEDQGIDDDYLSFIPSIIKAMLVHGCHWGDIKDQIVAIIKNSELGTLIESKANDMYTRQADVTREINRQYNNLICRWIGYGIPQIERVLECTEQRATLIGYGSLSDGEANIFRLPLPPSLGSKLDWRKVTITLAWLSPLSANTQKYRTASLWFELKNNQLTPSRNGVDYHTVRRGTVQHEIFEGQKAVPFSDGDFIEIKVNCKNDAAQIISPVSYGLVVSLEVAEGVDIAVYNEIKTQILPAIQIQQKIEGSGD